MHLVQLSLSNRPGVTRSFRWAGHCGKLESAKRRFATDNLVSDLAVITRIISVAGQSSEVWQ